MADKPALSPMLSTPCSQPSPPPSESLSKKVVRGGIWVFALRFTNRGLGFIRTIILARLLVPEDFGLLGIAMLAISTLETFSQTGFQAALIQKKENVESYLDTAWTVSAIRGVILFLILFFSAPLVATFFNSPQATLVIKVIAVSTLLSGFRNIGILFFQKELEFNKQFFYELSATLVDLTIAITLAFMFRNVWALVWGGVAANFVRLFMSYILHPYRPQIRFSKGEFKELFGFGKWIFGTSIITFLFNQGDDAFLGKVLGITALGFYQIAYSIGQLPATDFAKVISQITFPAYSKLQDDISKLKEGFLKTLNITVIFMIPLTGGVFMLAPEFTQIFLTQKWMPIIPALRILVIAGMIRALVTTGGALFHGTGAPKIDCKMNLIRLLTMIVIIYPLTLFFDMNGVALAVALGNLACIPIWYIETVKIINISLKDYVKIIFPPLLGTALMCSFLLLLKWTTEVNCLYFIFMVIVAIGVYSAFMYFSERTFNLKAFNDLKSIVDSLIGV